MTYLISGCVGTGDKLGSETSSTSAGTGSVWKSGNSNKIKNNSTKEVSQKVRFTRKWFDDATQDLARARPRPKDEHLDEEAIDGSDPAN